MNLDVNIGIDINNLDFARWLYNVVADRLEQEKQEYDRQKNWLQAADDWRRERDEHNAHWRYGEAVKSVLNARIQIMENRPDYSGPEFDPKEHLA